MSWFCSGPLFTLLNVCKFTPKAMAAELPSLLVLLTLSFLLNKLDASISPVIKVKHFYPLLL